MVSVFSEKIKKTVSAEKTLLGLTNNKGREMYQKRAVFFLDILGFGKKVEQASSDPKLMNKIQQCLTKIASYSDVNAGSNDFYLNVIRGDGLPDSDLQILTFSDSLVASVSCKQPESVALLAMVIQDIQFKLLEIGLLSRGGGDIGEMVHEENGIMFGPAFNSAYMLESKLADTPRILVGTKYMDYLTNDLDIDIKSLLESKLFVEYSDGHYGINSYAWVDKAMDGGFKTVPLSLINQALSDVETEIENNRYVPKVYSKLIWHRDYLKDSILKNKNYEACKDVINIQIQP